MHDIYVKTKHKHKIHLILNCNFDKRPEIDLNDVRAKGLITFRDHDAEIGKQIFGREPIFNQTLQVNKYPNLKATKKLILILNFMLGSKQKFRFLNTINTSTLVTQAPPWQRKR